MPLASKSSGYQETDWCYKGSNGELTEFTEWLIEELPEVSGILTSTVKVIEKLRLVCYKTPGARSGLSVVEKDWQRNWKTVSGQEFSTKGTVRGQQVADSGSSVVEKAGKRGVKVQLENAENELSGIHVGLTMSPQTWVRSWPRAPIEPCFALKPQNVRG